MKYVLAALICFVLGLAANGCAKKGQANVPINDELKKHFDYQVGSYWIFKDSTTGDIDSFVVVSRNFETGVSVTNLGYTQDQTSINVRAYSLSTNMQDSLSLGLVLFQNSVRVYSTLNDNIHNVCYDPLFNYPFTPGTIRTGDKGQGNGEISNIFPLLVINGISYTSVAEIDHFLGGTSPLAHNDRIYVNAEVGFVKMVIERPGDYKKAWELQRSGIIR